MSQLNVAFWNVQNLFEPSVAVRLGRGPQTSAERDAKLDRLASVIDGFFAGRGPDLLGLAEVATRGLFDELVDRTSHRFPTALRLWEDSPDSDYTGLGLVARDGPVARVTRLDVFRPMLAARPRAIIVDCELTGVSRPIKVAVNHWKSRMRQSAAGNSIGHQDRRDTADWLGARLNLTAQMECAIVMGDLNCQPDERPLNTMQLRGARHTSMADRATKAASTLYNTAWRFTTEPDPWTFPRPPGHRASRPKTTFGTGSSQVFDQLLVSTDALRGSPLSLREGSVHYTADPRTFRYTRDGHIKPQPWKAVGGGFTGASDHLPLLATFDVV